MSNKHLKARHGVICSLPNERLGYFGWPSIARTDSGKLVISASGLRYAHVCPYGKTVLFTSDDEGATWSRPNILNNTPLDDRDAGVVSLGGEKLLVTWFALDVRSHCPSERRPDGEREVWEKVFAGYTDDVVEKWRGSWVRVSEDGDAWSDFIRAPVNTPHGPIRCANGDLLYFGKQWFQPGEGDATESSGDIRAARSCDDGFTWTTLGSVPNAPKSSNGDFHEPHVVELSSGRLIGLIRYQHGGPDRGYDGFSLFQSESDDGGETWTQARELGIYGSPPHVIRHSSGALVCVYGNRRDPFGERAMISRDDGVTWDTDWIISDGPAMDLGYPASVELPDGRIMTVYYQFADESHKNTSVLSTVWELPG
jgi:sialidase-1